MALILAVSLRWARLMNKVPMATTIFPNTGQDLISCLAINCIGCTDAMAKMSNHEVWFATTNKPFKSSGILPCNSTRTFKASSSCCDTCCISLAVWLMSWLLALRRAERDKCTNHSHDSHKRLRRREYEMGRAGELTVIKIQILSVGNGGNKNSSAGR